MGWLLCGLLSCFVVLLRCNFNIRTGDIRRHNGSNCRLQAHKCLFFSTFLAGCTLQVEQHRQILEHMMTSFLCGSWVV